MMSGNAGGMGADLSSLLSGLFGYSGAPYGDAMKEYQKWGNKAQQVQNPFLQAGTGGLGNFQGWLQGMKDPSQFINQLMGQYKESPYAHNLQQQAMRAGTNAASMGGLPGGAGGAGIGSTPFMQQAQQNAGNIASQDQNQWLQNVLGINNQYGAGQLGLAGMGQNSANTLTDLFNQMGGRMGEASFGKKFGQGQDFWNMLGGGLGLAGHFFGM